MTGLLTLVVALSTGMPMPWESGADMVEDWSGVVPLSTDGSVPGPTLSDAVLELGGGDFYVEADCPATARVAGNVTTVCQVDDGYEQFRVAVLVLDGLGGFEPAEYYEG